MVLVDTCGWIEWLTDGALAERYAPHITDTTKLLVPTLIQFELYKWGLREKDEAAALDIIGLTEVCHVRPLDTRLSLYAAELATKHKLAMADAIIYASSLSYAEQLITSDAHFSDLPRVIYWPK